MAAWHEIGSIALCNPDELREVTVSKQVMILWCFDGEYHATQGLCPHAHAHLAKGKREGTTVICPTCGTHFDLLTGEVSHWLEGLHGPAKSIANATAKPKPLETYPLKIVDKRVMVQF